MGSSKGILRPRKVDHRSSLYSNSASVLTGHLSADAPNALSVGAISLSGAVANDEIFDSLGTKVPFVPGPVNLHLVQVETGSSVVTYRLIGEDYFGNRIQEDVVITGSSSAFTLHVFRRLITVTILSTTGVLAGGDTLTIGVNSGTGLRIPVQSLSPPEGAILDVRPIGAALTSYTYDRDRSALALVGASAGSSYLIYLDPEADEYL